MGWIREKWNKKNMRKKYNRLNSKLDKSSPSVKVWLDTWSLIRAFVRGDVVADVIAGGGGDKGGTI